MAMDNFNDASVTEVLIGGKVFQLSGADPEHMHKIAAFLNHKISEVKKIPGYKNLDSDYRELLLNLNLADEYFRSAEEAEKYRKSAADKESELYNARRDLVSLKLKLENALKQEMVLEQRAEEWKQKYEELRKESEL